MAERQLPKLNVAGSIPVSRSKNFVVSWWQLTDLKEQIRNVALVSVLLDLLLSAKNSLVFHHFASTT